MPLIRFLIQLFSSKRRAIKLEPENFQILQHFIWSWTELAYIDFKDKNDLREIGKKKWINNDINLYKYIPMFSNWHNFEEKVINLFIFPFSFSFEYINIEWEEKISLFCVIYYL